MRYRSATLEDIDDLVRLQQACHVSTLGEGERGDGFLNTVLDRALLTRAIEQDAVFVGLLDHRLVALAVCASWAFWGFSDSMGQRAESLPRLSSPVGPLTRANSGFWGPVCVSKDCRGQGAFEGLFRYRLGRISTRYEYLYTYVHADNPRSYFAHGQKAGFVPAGRFVLQGEHFHQLVRATR